MDITFKQVSGPSTPSVKFIAEDVDYNLALGSEEFKFINIALSEFRDLYIAHEFEDVLGNSNSSIGLLRSSDPDADLNKYVLVPNSAQTMGTGTPLVIDVNFSGFGWDFLGSSFTRQGNTTGSLKRIIVEGKKSM